LTTQEDVRALIVDNFEIPAEWETLPDDLPLVENYVLDSLDMLTLVSLVERDFAVQIPEEDVVLENFGTIERIAAYVEAARGSSPPAE
jgi:acyl carrier protein